MVTESWAEQNLYCPNCSSATLSRQSNNTRAFDFRCPTCRFDFQLKGQKTPFRSSITDGAYGAMMDAIRNDALPSFYFLHYEILNPPSPPRSGGEGRGEVEQSKSPLSVSLPPQSQGERAGWVVRNLLLVPHFAFPPSAIIKRPPLSATARRAGWVGCNFDLGRIPIEARIEIITTCSSGRESAHSKSQSRLTSAATIIKSPAEVREKFRRVKPLAKLPIAKRGWMLDVLTAVRSLNRAQFSNQDLYALEPHFQKLHPENRHIRDKIRQQLQDLRDAGFIHHPGRSEWRLS